MKKNKTYPVPAFMKPDYLSSYFKRLYPLVTEEETVKQYQARIVEEACNALSMYASQMAYDGRQSPLSRCCETQDAMLLASSAYSCSWQPGASNVEIYAEAEALLRCGWRPEGWGK